MTTTLSFRLDLDGVCADFDKGVIDLMGLHPDDVNPKSNMWDAINDHMDSGKEFFGALDMMHDAQVLFDYLKELPYDLKILTATGHIKPDEVETQKIAWVRRNLCKEIEVLLTRKGKDKAVHATPTTVLIDDRMKAIGPWREAGGIGILHTSAEQTIKEIEALLNGE
jgi:hypothetical protein